MKSMRWWIYDGHVIIANRTIKHAVPVLGWFSSVFNVILDSGVHELIVVSLDRKLGDMGRGNQTY